ncbi:unnamed protein product [Pieris macdunnoughi]|uniref:Reverse transcriptase n=1 Tax=Pieris macdunnoughi TaxID=345717 RepID=A0A821XQW7_9NEOP|nr:unnamed protein product [Pieris macdunnoughi]
MILQIFKLRDLALATLPAGRGGSVPINRASEAAVLSEGCTLALYADDTAHVATSLKTSHAATKLQRALDLLPEWLDNWRLAANPDKTSPAILAVGRAKWATHKLKPLFTDNLPLRTKLTLHKLYVRPHLTYAAPAWFSYAKETNCRRLHTVQNTLRNVVKAPRYVRNGTIARDMRMESIDEFIAGLAKRMFDRAA